MRFILIRPLPAWIGVWKSPFEALARRRQTALARVPWRDGRVVKSARL
jgi:hypothetical protein